MIINIAIDGPAGAGKSTMAKAVAKELGFIYVDTGAIYRAVGLSVKRDGLNPTSPEQVIPHLVSISVKLAFIDGVQKIFLNGEDVSEKIRTSEISMYASNVSAIPEVRSFLKKMQQDLAKKNNVVMDGRDIGTVILPNAQVKIFLTASPEVRAKRRYDELINRGEKVAFQDVLADVMKRDHNDSTRAEAPLRQAEDAVLLDTSGFEVEQSVAAILNIVREKISYAL